MDTLAWEILGSVAGVASVVVAIVFGIIPLLQSHGKARIPRSEQELQVGVTIGHSTQSGTGNIQVTQHFENYLEKIYLPVTPIQGPVIVGEIPQRAPAYQPRRELMIQLGESGPGVTMVRAVTGMRGVGKTQLAGAYARSRINECWRLVAWLNADNPAKVLNGLAEIAETVGLKTLHSDLESLGDAVRHWLEADGERCLVVFDNVTNMDFLARFAPSGGQCQVIITSNQLETLAFGEGIAVDVFTRQEALSFLAQRTGRPVDAQAREMADELGFLPLALAQAAAVIAAQHLDYPTYLARLRSVPVRATLKRTTGEPYAQGVAETILLALTAVADEDRTGLCSVLMNVIALLSTAGVPRTLLYSAGEEGLLSLLGSGTATEPESIDEAFGQLASASLLTFSMDDSTVAAHRLTMRVARERQTQDGSLAGLGAGIAQLLLAVTQSLNEPWRNRSAARDTIQQIMALHENLKSHLGEREATLTEALLRLRAWALSCLIKLGDSPAQAIEHGQNLVTDAERILGASHPATLKSRNDLGEAYRESQRLEEAIQLFERNLTDCEQTLGEFHPDTLETRDNLALTYRDARRLEEAIQLFERTLTDCEHALGESHPATLTERNNLASAYQDAGRLDEAIQLFERNLADSKRILGDSNPGTLCSQNNLALAYRHARRLNEAIPLFERTLTDCERILGSSHLNTLKTRNNLAESYWDARRLDEAIPLFERTLAERERILGVAHPDTLRTRNNLIRVYRDAGQPVQSERLRNDRP